MKHLARLIDALMVGAAAMGTLMLLFGLFRWIDEAFESDWSVIVSGVVIFAACADLALRRYA